MTDIKTYAEIVGNKVVNVVLWDGTTSFHPDEKLVEVADGIVGVGWVYEKGKFTDPTYVEDTTPAG